MLSESMASDISLMFLMSERWFRKFPSTISKFVSKAMSVCFSLKVSLLYGTFLEMTDCERRFSNCSPL